MPIRIVAALVPLVALTACSTPPTFGERLSSEGAAVSELGDQWSRGAALVERGERRITEGEQQIERGRRQVAEGRDLVNRGRRLMRESERRYREGVPRTAGDG
jgi:hypothetical protein